MALFDSTARKQAPAEPTFRTAPHNIEAEQALLGAILVNNEAFYRVSDFLEPKHFFEPIHQRIFELASGLVRAGKLATPVTLKTFLPADFDIAGLTVNQYLARGNIELAFDSREAPQTVKNFVKLARRGYFDGKAFHRVVPNFVIQDGDPTGTGSGGPGYTIRCEYNMLRYGPGMVGMALSGKDTGGSQWFITHSPQHHLDGRYTIFAHVVRGMDVVGNIVQGDAISRVQILD